MARSTRRRPAPAHPATEEIDLYDVLHALSDPTRMTIVRVLRPAPERAWGTFPVDAAPSPLRHNFKVLRESGVISQREEANRRFSALRTVDLERRFPGLLDTVLAALARNEPGGGPAGEESGHEREPGPEPGSDKARRG